MAGSDELIAVPLGEALEGNLVMLASNRRSRRAAAKAAAVAAAVGAAAGPPCGVILRDSFLPPLEPSSETLLRKNHVECV